MTQTTYIQNGKIYESRNSVNRTTRSLLRTFGLNEDLTEIEFEEVVDKFSEALNLVQNRNATVTESIERFARWAVENGNERLASRFRSRIQNPRIFSFQFLSAEAAEMAEQLCQEMLDKIGNFMPSHIELWSPSNSNDLGARSVFIVHVLISEPNSIVIQAILEYMKGNGGKPAMSLNNREFVHLLERFELETGTQVSFIES